MSLSARLGQFVAQLDTDRLPPEVLQKARSCVLNGYGIALGCHTTPYAPVARRAALAMDGELATGATLLGDGRKTTISGAVLANAALFHGRAQEDTCGAGHFGTIVLPLLTAMLEVHRLPMDRFLSALVAGYEAGGLLENAYSPCTTPSGLRASPLYGVVAAAAAASRLLALDAAQTGAALGNAASFAGGILQSFDDGTDEWRYQVGVAGRLGYVAAQLAAAGSVSAPRAFEGRAGFVPVFARTSCDAEALAARLGRDWSIHRVTFKPYPVCAFNQTPVIAALKLRERVGGRPLASLRVRMNPFETGYAGMDAKGPFSSLSGTLMSIPFCIANTLCNGTPTVRNMTTYDDAAVNALVERIELVPDEGVARLCCVIDATLAAGDKLSEEQTMTVGDYSYDWETVSALVRRVGAETDVPARAFDRLEAFAADPASASIDDVRGSFAMLPSSAS